MTRPKAKESPMRERSEAEQRVYIIEQREAPSLGGPWGEPQEIWRTETFEALEEKAWSEPRRHTHHGKPYWTQRRLRELRRERSKGKPE